MTDACAGDTLGGIPSYFANKTVFVTGATGFLGGILVEKILRSCPEVKKVYLLIRKKKNLDVQDRLTNLIALPLFASLGNGELRKLEGVEGDMSREGLGLNPSSQSRLLKEVHFIFHVAANINFSASLDRAAATNLAGTAALLALAKKMSHIQALIYVSTAYCNCTLRDTVAEKVYPNKWEPRQLLDHIAKASPLQIRNETSRILGGHPNTYSFTKLLAENLIKNEREHVPVAIVRPSVGTMANPIPGWVDNVNNGAFAFIAGAGRGVFRTVPACPDLIADLVPSDLLASLLIASAVKVAKSKKLEVFHMTSGSRNPLTWGGYCGLAVAAMHKHPCSGLVFYPKAKCRPGVIRNLIFIFIAHYLPGIFLDILARIRGEKPIVMDIQYKYTKGALMSSYFTRNQWLFSTENTEALCQELSEADKKEFSFNIEQVDWPKYMETCVLGIRKFFHGENPISIPKAKRLLQIWWYLDKASWVLISIFIWFLLSFFTGNDYNLFLTAFLTFFYIWL